MHSTRANLDTCADARGVAIVIDVIRAFTTAAYAFAAGARDVLPFGTLEQARMLGPRFPGTLLMGDVLQLSLEIQGSAVGFPARLSLCTRPCSKKRQ